MMLMRGIGVWCAGAWEWSGGFILYFILRTTLKFVQIKTKLVRVVGMLWRRE